VTPSDLARGVALGVAGFQILANGMLLVRGFSRLPAELAKEGATARIADLLRTMWVYGVLANLCLSVVLVIAASKMARGEVLARPVAIAIGVYYVVLGLTAYRFSPARHRGMLVFTVLGGVLLAAIAIT
jgi:hypothetical protein